MTPYPSLFEIVSSSPRPSENYIDPNLEK